MVHPCVILTSGHATIGCNMANYAEYFDARDAKTKPKFEYGNRVFGKWNKIPFIGMIIREVEKEVLVHVDLPVKYDKQYISILRLNRNDVKILKDYDK